MAEQEHVCIQWRCCRVEAVVAVRVDFLCNKARPAAWICPSFFVARDPAGVDDLRVLLGHGLFDGYQGPYMVIKLRKLVVNGVFYVARWELLAGVPIPIKNPCNVPRRSWFLRCHHGRGLLLTYVAVRLRELGPVSDHGICPSRRWHESAAGIHLAVAGARGPLCRGYHAISR